MTTAGELASFGGTLYDKTCILATDCHAKFGEGGEEEFSAPNLSQYGNAETVFGLISSIMHLAIGDYQEDAPTVEEYLQILAYLLVQNETVQPSDPFDRSSLPDVLLAPMQTTTAGELAISGATLFDKNCTFADCHAKFEGGGGPVLHSGASLSQYGNAETVYGIISSIMHLAIGDYDEDAPNLEEYLQILAYVLIETDLIQPGDPFDRNSLPNILLN
jgi:hypothetical protein